jgi:hypothetical protein
MATTETIDDIVAGDNYELNVTITGVPTGQTLTDAWLTAKSAYSDADPGLLQKHVTTANQAGIGQITDDAAGDTVGAVRFDLLPADTALLVPTFPGRPALYPVFDVQVKTSTGMLYTPITGRIAASAQVTQATS